MTSGYENCFWWLVSAKNSMQEILVGWKNGDTYIHIMPILSDVEKTIIKRMTEAGIKS